MIGECPSRAELAYAAGALYHDLRVRELSARDRNVIARAFGLLAALAGTKVEGMPPTQFPSYEDLVRAADVLESDPATCKGTTSVRAWILAGAYL